MRGFRLAGGKFDPAGASSTAPVGFAWKTGTPTISASGTTGGIVWISRAEGFLPSTPATLLAFDASNLARQLYSSDIATKPDMTKRDQPGVGIKFAVPTVANGKVYLGTKGEVTVYGLLGH